MDRLDQPAGELLPVHDEATQSVGMKRRMQRVGGVLAAELRGSAQRAEDPLRRRVAHDHVPQRVDDERRIRLLLAQDELQRAPNGLELGCVELAGAVQRCVAGGEQEQIPIAERNVEHGAEPLDHRPARPRAPRLEKAQMTDGHLGVGGQRELVHPACLTPLPEQAPEDVRLRFTCQVSLR